MILKGFSKRIFLPVMYGCGSGGLSNSLKLPESVCSEIISRIKSEFRVSWEWMKGKQEEAKQGMVKDLFGRPRLFKKEESYLARNFAVQGVAATVCQEKLIDLYKNFNGTKTKIAYSVHDGFGLVGEIKDAKQIYDTIKDTCEKESKLCAGLKMKVEVKFGKKLNEMKVFWK
jgi:DNA polymerase I-like protein with 3'-5' exonuclease and polymerase domains